MAVHEQSWHLHCANSLNRKDWSFDFTPQFSSNVVVGE